MKKSYDFRTLRSCSVFEFAAFKFDGDFCIVVDITGKLCAYSITLFFIIIKDTYLDRFCTFN